MGIHSRRVNAVMKRPTRPQIMQTILKKRPPHAGFCESCALFFFAGWIFLVSANGPDILHPAPAAAEE
jgi:hypothetical protein